MAYLPPVTIGESMDITVAMETILKKTFTLKLAQYIYKQYFLCINGMIFPFRPMITFNAPLHVILPILRRCTFGILI